MESQLWHTAASRLPPPKQERIYPISNCERLPSNVACSTFNMSIAAGPSVARSSWNTTSKSLLAITLGVSMCQA